MEIDGTKRKGPTLLSLDRDKKPKVSSENSYQTEDFELVIKSDRELSETIARSKNYLKLCSRLSDGGEKLRAYLKRHQEELERRQLLNKVTKRPLNLDWAHLLPPSTDCPPGIVMKSDREIEEAIARFKNYLKLCSRMSDGGEKLRTILKRHQDELQRRQLLVKVDNECEEKIQVSDDDAAEHTSVHNHHRMEINGCKRKEPTLLTLDWNKLLPLSTDRPPEIIMTSNKKPKKSPENSYQTEDLELVMKSDRELNETIAKLRANLKRHEDELQRRQLLNKVDNECKEMIQVSDSDDGVSRGKKQGHRKSLSSPDFIKLFDKPEDSKDSRTVNAFDANLFLMKSCNGRRGKPKNQVAAKGRSRLAVSSSSQEPSRSSKSCLVDCEKQMTSNDDKSTSSFSVPNSPQGPPSSNLRPITRRYYNVVEEDPPVQTAAQFLEELDPCVKDVTLYYPSRDDPDAVDVNHADMACLAPEAYLSSTIMNFYIRYLQQPTSLSESTTSNYHFFSTCFYNKLEKLKYEADSFRKFRKWWKDVSILEKAYILLPVHESAHWSLVIICFPTKEDEQGPILLHYDSLGLHDSTSIFNYIKRFLKEEWSYLRKSGTPLDLPISYEIWENLESKLESKRVTVPHQKNEYDSGLFVLFYMERFIKEAPERIKKKDLSMFGRQWFRPQEASNLRSAICTLLVEEFRKVKEKESTPLSQVLDRVQVLC